jgi:methionyl-tRNA synthetase
MKLAEDYLERPVDVTDRMRFFKQYSDPFDQFNYKEAIDQLWAGIGMLDEQIQKDQPFKVIKTDKEKGKKMIEELVKGLADVFYHLKPFLPEAADKIEMAIKENKKPSEPLFARIDQ